MLIFLASMTLVTVSRHFGLLWIGVEATTLASAPLIYFHRHHRSLEATWKYLLICSVGIALALLGNFFLGAAADTSATGRPSLASRIDLLKHAAAESRMAQGGLRAMLVGYGTKMGLAPLHTWLPDAHSEAPSVVSALLSGALLNCAFLGILRIYQLCGAPARGDFARSPCSPLGIVSVAVGAVFILGQSDFKRLLAYSSVENMGLLAIGLGLGGIGTVRRAFSRCEPLAREGNALPARRQHPGRLQDEGHRARCEACFAGFRGPALCGWRASWPSPERPLSACFSANS